jgi:hypothetical protein
METDVAHSHHVQDGAKNDASNGPDINKLAGDFSSGVKFSPRVKLMMEQSKIEIAAFIASLSPSAAAAEDLPNIATASPDSSGAGFTAGADIPAAATENRLIVAAAADDMPNAADPVVSARSATAAGVEDSVVLVQPAVEAQNATDGAAEVEISAAAGDPVAVVMQAPSFAKRAAEAAFSAASPKPRAEAARSFRASSDISGAVLQGQKTLSPPLSVAKETAPLSPITRDDGFISPKSSATSPVRRKKGTLLDKGAPWIATTLFSPPTPSSKSRKIEDVIAFRASAKRLLHRCALARG